MRIINIHAHLHAADEIDRNRERWQAQGYAHWCVNGIAPLWGELGNADLAAMEKELDDWMAR